MSEKLDLIIFSNGPGEISTWVSPVVERLVSKGINRGYRILLIIHPCQFSSGTEHIVAEKLKFFDAVIEPKEYIKMLVFPRISKRYNLKKRGVVISLGGDLLHPVLFRRRLKGDYKLYAYTNNPSHGKKYEKIFVRDRYVFNKGIESGVGKDVMMEVGDLVYSSIKKLWSKDEVRNSLKLKNDEKMIVFMPGSRDFEVIYMLPVFLKVVEKVRERLSNARFFILKSPFAGYDLMLRALNKAYTIKEAEVTGGRLVEDRVENNLKERYKIITDNSVEIPILEGGLEKWGEGIDLAVTLPGTNNIQLAYRGIPALVVAALNKPEVIPIEGIAGLLKWLPGGKYLLRAAVKKYVKKFPFASLPNIYTNKMIYPEIFGIIQTNDIVNRLVDIVKNEQIEEIKDRLKIFSYDKDPAEKILSEIFQK